LDRTVWSLGTNVQLDMGGVRFTSLTRYRDGDSEEGIDTFGTPDDVVVSFPTNDAQVFAQEFRLDNSSSASDMLWIAGLYYLHEDTYRKEDRDLFTVIDGAPSAVATREVNDEWNKTNSFGVFAEIDYDLLPKTNLALGVRYSRDEKDFSIIHSGTGPLASLVLAENPVIATGLSKTWDAITGRASLTYALTGNSMMYGSVSTGYKAGGFGTQPPTLETAMSAYDEENVVSYEVGAKTEWFGRRLRANIAIFSMAYDDIQTQEFSDSGAVVYTNAGEAETAGIEVDFKAAVTKRFTLSGSFSKLEGEYKTEDLADQNFAEMPDWTANLSGVFVIPLASGALIRCLAHYRGRSRIWHDEVNDPVWGIRDGIGIYSARVSWLSSDDRWELAMWGRNLTDEAEMVNINTQAFMSQRSVGYGAPRTFGLSLSWRYAIADDE
jgi:iron complex outermembrane receptor protein